MLKPLANWMATQATLTVGTTLFAGTRPSSAPDLCTTVREPGTELVRWWDAGKREKSVQLLTRGATYMAARDEATRVFEAVVNQFGVDIGDDDVGQWHLKSVTGTAPQHLGQDSQGRHEFAANLVVMADRL